MSAEDWLGSTGLRVQANLLKLAGLVRCRSGYGFLQPSGLSGEVVAFRDVGRASGGDLVVRDGRLMIAGHFRQMGVYGVETMMALQAAIGVESIQQVEAAGRALDHRGGDGVIEHPH